MTNANSKIKYGLNDTIWVKNKENILIIDPFIPFNMNFQTSIWMPKVNLAKILSEKSWSVRTIQNFPRFSPCKTGGRKARAS